MAEKNVWIALILSFFIAGLGNAYNGLYKRFALEFVVRLVLSGSYYIIGGTMGLILSFIGILWHVYCIYDTGICTKAINEGSSIPLLAGNIDIE